QRHCRTFDTAVRCAVRAGARARDSRLRRSMARGRTHRDSLCRWPEPVARGQHGAVRTAAVAAREDGSGVPALESLGAIRAGADRTRAAVVPADARVAFEEHHGKAATDCESSQETDQKANGSLSAAGEIGRALYFARASCLD